MSALSAGLFAKHVVNSAQRSSGLVWGLMAQFPGFASHGSSLHLAARYQYWKLLDDSGTQPPFSHAVVKCNLTELTTKIIGIPIVGQ